MRTRCGEGIIKVDRHLCQCRQSRITCVEFEDRNRQVLEVLLAAEILVNRDQDIESFRSGCSDQMAIGELAHTDATCVRDLMSVKEPARSPIHAMIEQNLQ